VNGSASMDLGLTDPSLPAWGGTQGLGLCVTLGEFDASETDVDAG
jgi:hypothetical protein